MQKPTTLFISLLIVLFIQNCNPMMQIAQYQYSDGSGNTYLIKKDSIQYIPVKPHESSSGVYDGGDPVKKEISDESYQQLKKLIESASTKTEIHIKDRMMGSGLIKIDNKKEKVFILKPNTPEKKEIEDFLKSLIE